jgi:biotin synthase-related radical SAM superfamily protein
MLKTQFDEINQLQNIKLQLLANNYLKISRTTIHKSIERRSILSRVINKNNIYSFPWIFFNLGNKTRVRMVVVSSMALYELIFSDQNNDQYEIIDRRTHLPIATELKIEEALYHCPKQLFFNLYEFCSLDCKFCPLPINSMHTGDSLKKILKYLDRIKVHEIEGIGFTAGIPANHSGKIVSQEMAKIVRKIREKIGNKVPIGVSPLHPSEEDLIELKDSGVNEVRINIETPNRDLAHRIMIGKDPELTLKSIKYAIDIFGRGKVSSNIILGIGETDDDVIYGVEELAKIGAIATLYPYDPVQQREKLLSYLTNNQAGRPDANRIWRLVKEHRKILYNYKLNPDNLRTMCPHCGASHLMPGLDL